MSSWNLNGWTPDNAELRSEIIRHINSDIFCLSETHLTGDNVVQVPGYLWFDHKRVLIHRDAPHGSGGVGILVKDKIADNYDISIVDKSVDGLLILELRNKSTGNTVVVISCYLPPSSSNRNDSTEFFAHLIAKIYACSYADCIVLGGDFNARIGNLKDIIESEDVGIPDRIVLDHQRNEQGPSFIDFLNDIRFCVVNGRITPDLDNFTFVSPRGKSVVDYFIVPQDYVKQYKSFRVELAAEVIDSLNLGDMLGERCKCPDHSILTLCIDFNLGNFEDEGTEYDNVSNEPRNVRYFFEGRPDIFMNNEIWSLAINRIIDNMLVVHGNQDMVDEVYKQFCETIAIEMDTHLRFHELGRKTRKRYRRAKPFWNDELSGLWKDMVKKERAFVRCHQNCEARRLRVVYFDARSKFDRRLRVIERSYARSKIIEIDEIQTADPRAFWDSIKKLGPRKSAGIPEQVYDANGTRTGDKGYVLNTWQNAYFNLYNRPPEAETDFEAQFFNEVTMNLSDAENEMNAPGYVENEFVNGQISYDEVKRAILNTKNKKSPGFDGIPNEALKNDDVILALYHFFNVVFETGTFPSTWLRAVIIPIPKSASSDPYVPLNYRGISLLSSVYKVFTSILNRRIVDYMEFLNLYNDEQNGFRKKRSCTDHIFTASTLIRNRLLEGLPTFACFVDMRKAFDWVDRDLLLFKLLRYNIDGKIFRVIKNLLQGTLSSVKINNLRTDWFTTTTGVRQGDVLSPTLFNIFLNDLVDDLNDLGKGLNVDGRHICCLLYADDIILLSENEDNLQAMLDRLDRWCKNWRLKVNCDKTQVMHFRKKRSRLTDFVFRLNETPIKVVNKYKYLGVIFDEFLEMNCNAEVLSQSGGRALGGIIHKFREFRDIGFQTFTKLYENGVAPILDYGSEVWGFGSFDKLESIQNRAIRYFLGLPPRAPILGYQGDFGWLPARYRRWLNMLRYWNHLCSLNNDGILKYAFRYDLQRSVTNTNWCSQVKLILSNVGMDHLVSIEAPTPCNLSIVRERIELLHSESWKQQLAAKPKLRTYVKFKDSVRTEVYVSSFLPRHQRALFAQFRCGVLPLEIETGRFSGTPPDRRICRLCDSNEPEDEQHFLCNCVCFENLRRSFFDSMSLFHPQFVALSAEEKLIFCCKNRQIETAKFIVRAWNTRKSLLFSRR